MLKPIPSKIMRSECVVKVCTGMDMYQNQTYNEQYNVKRVHLQPTERIMKSTGNTDLQLSSVLFVDAKRSTPALDWRALLKKAHDNGGDMRVIVRGIEYTAAAADGLRDDSDRLHHWEIALV